MYSRSKSAFLLIVMILTILLVRSPIPTHDNAQLIITPNKAFSLSTTPTYTNKTIHFPSADPYEGYSYWTYEVGGPTQGPDGSNRYAIGTDTDGQDGYFGFDEFVNHSFVRAEVLFESNLINSPYNFVPLGYFYQKTNLESKTRWALAIEWSQTGIDLVYNTGNGNTPTSVNLVSTTVSLSVEYYLILSNLGDQTYVKIQDTSTYPSYPIIYEGYTTTETYDATSLYAGFGQYSTSNENNNGFWDDFTIIDTEFTYSADEYGQGIYMVTPYQNSSGSFVTLPNPDNTMTYHLNFTANTALRFDAGVLLNYTTLGLSHPGDIDLGRNYLRVNLEMFLASESVFSLQNMTFDNLDGLYETGIWWYSYVDIVNVILVAGQMYTVVITLEVFTTQP